MDPVPAPPQPACPQCGLPVSLDHRFCSRCGAVLSATSPAPHPAAPRAAASGSVWEALEAERKQVTVLFADVKGSTELLADLDPEDARELLDPVIERMIEAVHRYGGTVTQVMGDGIMALFGAPVAIEDHAVRACYAALHLQHLIGAHALDCRFSGKPTVQARVGLNSGEVVVRSLGGDVRLDYTAVGQTTHLAARMEQLAEPGTILLTGATFELVEGYVDTEALGPRAVKGFPAPVEVFRLTGATAARSRLQAAASRGLSPFVGRQREQRELLAALARAAGGRGQVVAVIGEPGLGKSRLAWELVQSPACAGWTVMESSSVPYGPGVSYFPVIELLRGYFQIDERDDARKIADKVTSRVVLLDAALEPHVTPLLALLDVPVDDPGWSAADPAQRRQRTIAACLALIERQSRERPLLIVVENLHAIDSETQTVLDRLVDVVAGARILLLVNYRPEYRHRWTDREHYTELRLAPLDPPSLAALMDALLGTDPSLEGLRRLLVDRTGGNPFFLEEAVRELSATGALAGPRGAHTLTRPRDAIHIPSTVQAVLAARIDRLRVDDKHLLQAAAVIGKTVPDTLLRALVTHAPESVNAALSRLQAAGLLYADRLFPEVEYSFTHALTHDVAYRTLLRQQRRELHARIVSAIEQIYRERLPEHVDRLAHHALHGEVWDKAAVYAHRTATRAATRSANREAVTYFEQALHALEQLPQDPATRERAVDVRLELRSSLMPLGEFARTLELLRDTEERASALGDRLRAGKAVAYMANLFWWLGDHPAAASAAERALAIAESADDLPLRVLSRFFLVQADNAQGRYRRVVRHAREIVETLQGDLVWARFGLSGLVAVMARAHLVRALAELGEFEESAHLASEASELAERGGQPYDVVAASIPVGDVAIRRGDTEAAIPVLDRALALLRSANLPAWFPSVASALGAALTLAGHAEKGRALLDEACERALAMKIMFNQPLRLVWLGEA
ncbi:MAG TPA: adenylate/guanylate cyclase domain-containing protein, partial [Candidatus Tectomicrobia bacterium]|nr:adenylate/guanylate cyclase domain-containing protein [Candidatus Tectomicrobia bacterium]